ncbi:MAG TPA: ImmA/IrrE family metallo-endopeptidase [Streptosporangiaceae bacterium]|nr:ImmA/IrrE family metallo-endopeptidase [Streptosporangiaceae bacterium]
MHEHDTTNTLTEKSSVLGTLRALLPPRRLLLSEALRLAELQANRLLHLQHVVGAPVPQEIVTSLPRVLIDYDPDLPRHAASGLSDWDAHRRAWVITLNPDEPATRQRFTVIHEYKHIVDHGHPGLGGRLPRSIYGLTPVEYIAEYFAGCVLMPKRWLRAAFYGGIQRPSELARLFDVSTRAMTVRLEQIGLIEHAAPASQSSQRPGYRLQPHSFHRYHRPLSPNYIPALTQEVAA